MKLARLTTLLSSVVALTAFTVPVMAQDEPSDSPIGIEAMATSAPESAPEDAFPLSSTFAAAPEGFHHGGPMHNPFLESITADQFEKFHDLKNQFLDQIGPKVVAIKSKERKLHDALVANSIDGGKIKSLQDEINGLKSDISNAKIDYLVSASNVLTADQRKQLRDHLYKHSLPHMEGGEHHGWGHHEHHGM